MKRAIFLIILTSMILPMVSLAQQVIITDDATYTTPEDGAVLDIQSTTRGMIIPRMTTAQRTTLGNTTPVNGVLVYDTQLASFFYWDTDTWRQLAASGLNLSNYKFGDATNYATFESDGTLAFYGTATTWDDIMIPGFATRASTYSPTFGVFMNGVYINYFQDVSNNENQVFFSVQFPHSWAQTQIRPHIHWSPETDPGVSGAVVRWGLEYTWVEYNSTTPLTFPATSTVYVNASAASGSQKKHLIAGFTPITPSSDQDGISSMMVCRLFRNSSNVADTYTGNAGFLQFDIHFEKNTEGSRTEFDK
jgi:hypothetical protein